MTFKGFERPTDNYSKLPHSFIDLLPTIDTMAEMKVVLYLLRHTWGFSEFGKPKKLTTDEFANGRKKRDQSRMDAGTGLSENSVRAGIEKAVEHGFFTVETDESDKARIEKWYCLNMEVDSEIESRPAKIAPLDSEIAERSEKETKERIKKEKHSADKSAKPATPPEVKLFREVTSRYPNKVNFENVTNIIKGVSKRLGRDCSADDLRPFYAAWCAKGFKPVNLAWLSWAETGIIPEMRQAQNKNSGADALMQYAQNIGAV